MRPVSSEGAFVDEDGNGEPEAGELDWEAWQAGGDSEDGEAGESGGKEARR